MKSSFVLVLCILLSTVRFGNTYKPLRQLTAQDVAKPAVATWISDQYQYLRDDTKLELNALCTQLETDLTDELAVVLIPRRSHGTIEEFTREVFDLWGVGKATKNNGIMILLAMQDREFRIQTGAGSRVRLNDRKAAEIVELMKPHLRAEDVDGAVDIGVKAVVDVLNGGSHYVTSDFAYAIIWAAITGGGVLCVLICIGYSIQRNLRERDYEHRLRLLQRVSATNGNAVCCICLETLTAEDSNNDENPAILTSCNHPFHFRCLAQWLERSSNCPLCRNPNPAGPDTRPHPSAAPEANAARPRSPWRWPYFNSRPTTRTTPAPSPHQFRRFNNGCWNGYACDDVNALLWLQQEQYADVRHRFNANVVGDRVTFTRVVPPPSTSSGSSGSASFGGGCSFGGGGSSGCW